MSLMLQIILKHDDTIKYLKKLNYKYFYFFKLDFDYYNYKIKNLIFLFMRILFFGIITNKIYLKKLRSLKIRKIILNEYFNLHKTRTLAD